LPDENGSYCSSFGSQYPPAHPTSPTWSPRNSPRGRGPPPMLNPYSSCLPREYCEDRQQVPGGWWGQQPDFVDGISALANAPPMQGFPRGGSHVMPRQSSFELCPPNARCVTQPWASPSHGFGVEEHGAAQLRHAQRQQQQQWQQQHQQQQPQQQQQQQLVRAGGSFYGAGMGGGQGPAPPLLLARSGSWRAEDGGGVPPPPAPPRRPGSAEPFSRSGSFFASDGSAVARASSQRRSLRSASVPGHGPGAAPRGPAPHQSPEWGHPAHACLPGPQQSPQNNAHYLQREIVESRAAQARVQSRAHGPKSPSMTSGRLTPRSSLQAGREASGAPAKPVESFAWGISAPRPAAAAAPTRGGPWSGSGGLEQTIGHTTLPMVMLDD